MDTCDQTKGIYACRKGLECIEDTDGNFICACPEGSFLYSDGTCRLTSACKHSMECDKSIFFFTLKALIKALGFNFSIGYSLVDY